MVFQQTRLQPSWINPQILKWARLWRGRTVEEAANHVKKKPVDIEAWEKGEKSPTIRQAHKLASFYNRAFLELLQPNPPILPEQLSLHDFRTHANVLPPADNWEFQAIQQWVETQRLNALDLFDEIGETPPSFPTSLFFTVGYSPDEAANHARKALSFPFHVQAALSAEQSRKLPDLLRQAFEDIGVLTLKCTDLSKFKVRGICFAEFPLPVIVFTRESPSAQVFTLAHEFAHVTLKASGISGRIEESAETTERWCNRFAASFLMPTENVFDIVGERPMRPSDDIDDEELRLYARRFNVSQHAMLIRLVDLGYVQPNYYWNVKKNEFDQAEHDFRGGGRSEYYGTRYLNSQGNLYTSLVLEAWESGKITNDNAARFMGIKNIRHLIDIRDHFGQS